MAVVAVKYCGGCNPRYDRVKFVQGLQRDFPELEFSGADAVMPDFALIVCGCPAKCVSHEHITCRSERGKFVIDSPDDKSFTLRVSDSE